MIRSKKGDMVEEILIIAGEVSGDMHGAALVRAIKNADNQIRFSGIGGNEMEKEGVNLLYHSSKMSFLGMVEVLKHLPFIRRVKKEVISHVRQEKIKLAILIDYPGFNLSLARALREDGVKIIYYISPQIWAWGKGRIKKIKELVDKMLVILPFEEKLYKDKGVNCEYVGHPLVDRINGYSFISKDEIYNKHGLELGKEILLVQPGSRKQEVKEMYPVILEGAKRLADELGFQIVVNCSQGIEEDLLGDLSSGVKPAIIKGFTYELMKYAKLGIIKSGTSTLEAGLLGLPMIIVYKTNYITYLIGRSLVRLKNIGLINIVLGKNVVPELIQGELTSDNIYVKGKEVINKRNIIEKELSGVRKILGEIQASDKAAEIVLAYVK